MEGWGLHWHYLSMLKSVSISIFGASFCLKDYTFSDSSPYQRTTALDGLVGEMQANGEVAPLAYLNMVQRVFFLMGGIALLTLVVNGLTAGPLLIRLGLVTPSECRKKVVENYYQHLIQYTLKEYVALLTEDRFRDVDFTVVKTYIPFFGE